MQSGSHIYIFFWMFTILISNSCSTENSHCSKNKSYIFEGKVVYYNETTCCDNYGKRDGTCVECEPGFFQPGDKSQDICIPCLKGSFGKKCAYDCNCLESERCDRITGCVPKKEAKQNEKTTLFSKTFTHEEDTGVSFPYIGPGSRSNSIRHSCVYNLIEKSTTSNDKKTVASESSTSSPKHNFVMIYVACTGALAVLITFAVLGRQKYQKLEMAKLSATRRTHLHVQNVQERNEVFHDLDNGSVYEIIEEQNMIGL